MSLFSQVTARCCGDLRLGMILPNGGLPESSSASMIWTIDMLRARILRARLTLCKRTRGFIHTALRFVYRSSRRQLSETILADKKSLPPQRRMELFLENEFVVFVLQRS